MAGITGVIAPGRKFQQQVEADRNHFNLATNLASCLFLMPGDRDLMRKADRRAAELDEIQQIIRKSKTPEKNAAVLMAGQF